MSVARPQSYAELARRHVRGRDFDIVLRERRGAAVAIVAPHGGAIERGTSSIAAALAGDDFHLYRFEGRLGPGSFEALHLPSQQFDEPRCLALLARCRVVVTVHGCEAEPDPGVLIGGRDGVLAGRMASALREAGIAAVTEGHRFPGRHPDNVCNRGASGAGVQLEWTGRLRGGPLEERAIAALRAVLLEWAADSR